MNPTFTIAIAGNHFVLSPLKLMFWTEKKAIILSDMHLGKTGHFRKAGIAVPNAINEDDLQSLLVAIDTFEAEKIIVVGDMFHSVANKELNAFAAWRKLIHQIEFHLVKGNHDILPLDWYEQQAISVHHPTWQIGNIQFEHEPPNTENATIQEGVYTFSGHLHPSIRLKIGSRQLLQFPCFHVRANQVTLPAFGRFCGSVPIKPRSNDQVYAVVNQQIIAI